MEEQKALTFFHGMPIRYVWFKDEWWFSVFDIVQQLTGSSDTKQYIKKLRQRDPVLYSNWGTICTPLPMPACDSKMRETNCVNTEGAFRIIESIPSSKAEPMKLWLAKVGYERIKEIQNPELAQDRIKEIYRAKGYSEEWIEKRIRGIAIRQELTEEWKARQAGEERGFAILTNEISKASFGKTVEEYREYKRLKKENLRDHMTDWELILTMVGEKAATDITEAKGSQGFDECKESAIEGGEIAGNTRKEIERKTGKPVVSDENYLDVPEKEKRKQIKGRKLKVITS